MKALSVYHPLPELSTQFVLTFTGIWFHTNSFTVLTLSSQRASPCDAQTEEADSKYIYWSTILLLSEHSFYLIIRWYMRRCFILFSPWFESSSLSAPTTPICGGLFLLTALIRLDPDSLGELFWILLVAERQPVFVSPGDVLPFIYQVEAPPFWSICPAKILLGAVLGARALTILIAAYGIITSSTSYGWAFDVWKGLCTLYVRNWAWSSPILT
jgi:hypothetical protein